MLQTRHDSTGQYRDRDGLYGMLPVLPNDRPYGERSCRALIQGHLRLQTASISSPTRSAEISPICDDPNASPRCPRPWSTGESSGTEDPRLCTGHYPLRASLVPCSSHAL